MKRFFFPSVALILLATSLQCANLAPIQPGCGNNIVEAGEDCDGSVDSVEKESGKMFACARPKDPGECHFVTTNGAVCPSSLRTGADGICRKPGGGFPSLSKTIAPMIGTTAVTGRDPIVADFNGDEKLDVALDHVHAHQAELAVIQYLDDEAELSTFTIPKRGGVDLAVGDFLGRTPEDLKAQHLDNLLPDDPYPLQLDVLVANGTSVNTFAAYQGNSDPGFTPIALSSNDPGADFRVVPVSAAVFDSLHEDLEVAALLMDCTNPPPMSLCSPPPGFQQPGVGLPITAIWGTEFPPTLLKGPEVVSPSSMSALGMLVMSARAPGGPTSRCDDLMLAFRGASALRDAPLCGPAFCDKTQGTCAGVSHACLASCPSNCDSNCRDLGQRAPFDIPLSTPGCPSPTIDNAMMVDANHDGIPDIVVSVKCPSPAVLELDGMANAMMHATGTYAAPRLVGQINGNGCKSGVLLAAGDIDQDGVLDYVFSDGVWLSRSSGGQPLSPLDDASKLLPTAGCWVQAAVVDVNHDGLLDVVGLTAGDMGMTVLLGNGTSLPTSVSLPADDVLQQFVIGDFDGDGTNDIVAATQAPGGAICSTENKLLIAWGTPLGIPSDLVQFGQLPAVVQLAAERLFADPNDISSNGITDLAVLSACTPEQAMMDPVAKNNVQAFVRHGVAVFNGSTDRTLVSPYVLRSPGADLTPPDIKALTVGAPYSAPPAPEPAVFAVFRKDGIQLATLPTTGGGNISAVTMNGNFLKLVDAISDTIQPAITTAAIGGRVDVFVAYAAANNKDVTLLDIQDGKVTHQATLQNAVGFSSAGHLHLVAGDFDGQGGGIAIVAESDAFINISKETLAIWYASTPDTLCQVPSPTMDGITGIATVDTGRHNTDSSTTSVAISTAHDVFLYAPFSHCSPGTGTSVLNPHPGEPAVVGIASGDMNRDGLEDLVILRTTKSGTPIEIYEQARSSIGVATLAAPGSASTSTSTSATSGAGG